MSRKTETSCSCVSSSGERTKKNLHRKSREEEEWVWRLERLTPGVTDASVDNISNCILTKWITREEHERILLEETSCIMSCRREQFESKEAVSVVGLTLFYFVLSFSKAMVWLPLSKSESPICKIYEGHIFCWTDRFGINCCIFWCLMQFSSSLLSNGLFTPLLQWIQWFSLFKTRFNAWQTCTSEKSNHLNYCRALTLCVFEGERYSSIFSPTEVKNFMNQLWEKKRQHDLTQITLAIIKKERHVIPLSLQMIKISRHKLVIKI
jgi:hypothetical protein